MASFTLQERFFKLCVAIRQLYTDSRIFMAVG